jgi:hydroxymethylpyrimidine/phosphomethylpyrimidine kinase
MLTFSFMAIPVALTIAGSDPSGGAGIQADIKTFHQFRVYGEAVITLITVQNTRLVSRVEVLDSGLVAEQMMAVLADIPPAAIKTGALGNVSVVRAVARVLRETRIEVPLIVDPVMISKHGTRLIDVEAQGALIHDLIPGAFLVTPNLAEAAVLAGLKRVDTKSLMREAAQRIRSLGAHNVLVKGGHLGPDLPAVDLLLLESGESVEFAADRIDTPNTHGTGCTYSAAITAAMARGFSLTDAVTQAKDYVTEAIRTNPNLGHGNGPLNHRPTPKSRATRV